MKTSSYRETQKYRTLLLSQTPILDVRAPMEFARGAIPSAVNIPIMKDSERNQVGICFRKHGRDAAITLGHQIVHGSHQEERIEQWTNYLYRHPNAVLCCARGGLRSTISQRWLADTGLHCPTVSGGFKAIRQFLSNFLSDYCSHNSFIVLSGMTGTGKTAAIKQLSRAIDLEGAANHKGSSFGRPLDQQPSQISFENRIAVDLLLITEKANFPVVVEDESRMIGACQLPPYLKDSMHRSSVAVIEMPFEERLERLWSEYIVERYNQTIARYPSDSKSHFANHLIDSLMRIRKRLGGVKTKRILRLLNLALQKQEQDGFALHRTWLAEVTRGYYDPMYAYQLDKKQDRIEFRGSASEVAQWLRLRTENPARI